MPPDTTDLHRAAPLLVLLLGLLARPAAAEEGGPAAPPASPSPPAAARPPESTAPASPNLAPGPAPGQVPAPAAAAPAEVKRVLFVPDFIKDELKEEIKKEVLAEAKREGWAAPHQVPEWLHRFTFSGDVRIRFQRDMFGKGNANQGQYPDFNAINSGSPFDVNGVDLSADRYLNVDQDRNRLRLRARLGVEATMGRGFSAGVRLASGDSSSPVSTQQTLGTSPGTFSKFQLWLDRAYLRYRPVNDERGLFSIDIGRMANPFFATDLIWWEDLSMDGLALQGAVAATRWLRPFVNAGAFPIYSTAFNFAADQPAKFSSYDKWLLGAQVGFDLHPTSGLHIELAAAFYDFVNLVGRLSSPCDTNVKGVNCDTDESRPTFAQKGNTYRVLRTPSAAARAAETAGVAAQYQYFGLASAFREVAATGRIDDLIARRLKATVRGEFVYNVGFDDDRVRRVAINNFNACIKDQSGNCLYPYAGGKLGYLVSVQVGSPTQDRLGDWHVNITYRYLESDAVVDGLNNPDFGLGGTNLKGVIFGAGVAFVDHVMLSARFMSADGIVGDPYRVDTLLVDLVGSY